LEGVKIQMPSEESENDDKTTFEGFGNYFGLRGVEDIRGIENAIR